jgi:hypothetical protein
MALDPDLERSHPDPDENLPSSGGFPPLTVPCPVHHDGHRRIGGFPPARISAELPDGTKVWTLCRKCDGRGELLTDFGYEVFRVLRLFREEG